ncbi:MAG: hypothetical protein V3V00_15015 [Saprospiraceae bacterium]
MKHQDYFQNTISLLVNKLTEDHMPSFGLMTAQHMIEHLIWVTKSTAKHFSPVPEELDDKQRGFMRFIQKGSNFKYMPSDKTAADLKPCKYQNLERAKAELPEAINKLKNFLSSRTDNIYNPMLGSLTPDELATFHYKHYQWHLTEQFGL